MKKTIQSTNPYTGEKYRRFELLTREELDEKIEVAHSAFLQWKNTSFDERKELFHKLADVIEEDLEEYAQLQTQEMGMLYSSSKNGLKGTAHLIRWFADNAEKVLGEKEYEIEGTHGVYTYDSLGVIYGVGPWNFPYNQVLRAAVPNILAGNTTVYKHASNVPLCAEQIEKFFRKAGFPEGIYTNLFISSSDSEHIISNTYIRGVNLTGGEGAGTALGSLAGKYLKPSVLELGGNDPLLILDHSDTQKMVAETQACRFNDVGQRCNSSKRFIVLDTYYDEFVEGMKRFVEALTVGNPMDITTNVQPLVDADAVKTVDFQVQNSINSGAKLVIGGKTLGDHNTFYAPTILADVKKGMECYDTEIFGPVMSIIKSSSVEESIKIANDSEYGLSAVVFGDDVNQCRDVAKQLEGGMIFINQVAGSKAYLPFGGVKKSGYGKENGEEGLKSFTNKKVILY